MTRALRVYPYIGFTGFGSFVCFMGCWPGGIGIGGTGAPAQGVVARLER